MKEKERATSKIAVKIKELRLKEGLSQREIAQKLGISQMAYSSYECNKVKISLEILTKLCALFHVSSDYLLGIELSKNSLLHELPILRCLGEETRVKTIQVNGALYSLHAKGNEVLITDLTDYTKIYSIQSAGLNKLTY